MAYIQPNGRVRIRALSRPVPRYDFEPVFLGEPDEEGMREQLSDLISQAIRTADSEGHSLENGDVPDKWKIDWGQRIASNTYRQEVERLVADIPSPYIEKVLLRSFYRAIMDMIEIGDGTLTYLMGIHALDGIVSDATKEVDDIQLRFSQGDAISEDVQDSKMTWGNDDAGTAGAEQAGKDA